MSRDRADRARDLLERGDMSAAAWSDIWPTPYAVPSPAGASAPSSPPAVSSERRSIIVASFVPA